MNIITTYQPQNNGKKKRAEQVIEDTLRMHVMDKTLK